MLSASAIRARKGGKPIAMITAYDACLARMAEASGIDMILVGDSVANVVLGYSSTREVGMNEMLMFVAAVRRGAPNTHVVADMPWQSDCDVDNGVANARRFLKAGADSVKIEGIPLEVIRAIRADGIEVVGHLGLLPQTATSFKQQGNTPEDAERIMNEARAVANAGACAIVLEHIPEQLGALVSQSIADVPIIGIGAGKKVDGQVLVIHDALGMHPFKCPPFAHKFADLYAQGVRGLELYVKDVQGL